jgi:phosphotransferase system IIA component
LIHCGIDTVQLDGKHFTTYVEQGSEITKGTLMLSFDIEAVKNEGFSVETPVVVTNLSEGQHIEINAKGNVEHGEEAFRIVK